MTADPDREVLARTAAAQGFPVHRELPPVARFGDDPATAGELAGLVRRGVKRATAALLWKWRADGRSIPAPGDRQLIVDGDEQPRALIEMTAVDVVPFEEVDAAFAREEGEGDRSLEHWRRVHWGFFRREAERIGRQPDRRMPVICMRFRRLPPTDVGA